MKLIVELKDSSLLKNTEVDGWIVNIGGISCYYDKLYLLKELPEIVETIHNNNQKVYLNARKIIHEQDIETVTKIVIELETLGVDYYFYSDLAFFEIANNLGITQKLIYQVNTYMTNSSDIMLMLSENHSVVVSTELSYDEIANITKNVDKPLYLHAFGYYPIFHSRRELITNYQKYRGLVVDTSNQYDVVEELRDSHYPIEQNENGMVVYLDGAYCLEKEILALNHNNLELNYIINSKYINLQEYQKVINLYLKIKNNVVEFKDFDNLNIALTKGLLYEKSKLLKKEGGMVCE